MRQLALFPTTEAAEVVVGQETGGSIIHMVSIDPEKNRFRFYTICWGQTSRTASSTLAVTASHRMNLR